VIFAFANIALLAAGAAATFSLARRAGMKPIAAAVASLAGFLMPPALWMGTALLSEPLWLALAIPWLVWAERAVDDLESSTAASWISLGLTAGLIALVRTQAATLVVGLVLILALRRHWKPALIVAGTAGLALMPWQLWVAHHVSDLPPVLSAKYGPYAQWLADGFHSEGVRLMTATVARNLASVGMILGGMFGPASASWIGVVLLIVPMLAGGRRLARRAPVTLAMMLVHGAIILAWPFEPRRFVWTSWPFVVLWIAAGVAELHESVGTPVTGVARARAARLAHVLVRVDTTLLMAAATLTTAIMLWTGAYRAIAEGQARRIESTLNWVDQHADAHAVIATEDETAVFLYTGRLAVPTTSFTAASYAHHDGLSASVLDEVVAQYHPDLTVVSWKTSVEAAQRLATGPKPTLRMIDVVNKSAVFARVSDGSVAESR
jgi:hypothetical protein